MTGVMAVLDVESFLLGIAAGGGGGQNPYYYGPASVLQLSRGNLVYPENTVVTIDCSMLTDAASMLRANSSCPGYEEVRLVNIPNAAMSLFSFAAYHGPSGSRGFKRLVLDGNILVVGDAGNAFNANTSLVSITGGAFDFTSAKSTVNFMTPSTSIVEMRVVKDTIKISSAFSGGALSDNTLVSIGNGLDGTVSGQTLTLNSAKKDHCNDIKGTVTAGVFAIDAGGDTSLLDFITEDKGWTLA